VETKVYKKAVAVVALDTMTMNAVWAGSFPTASRYSEEVAIRWLTAGTSGGSPCLIRIATLQQFEVAAYTMDVCRVFQEVDSRAEQGLQPLPVEETFPDVAIGLVPGLSVSVLSPEFIKFQPSSQSVVIVAMNGNVASS